MALRYYMPNQVPQLIEQGTQDRARAIEGFGQNIGRGLANLAERMEKKKEEEKRILDNAKAAETLFQANPELQEQIGVSPEAFKALSAREKAATMQGAVTHLTLQRAMAEQRRAQTELASADALRKAVGQASRGRMADYYENPERYSSPPVLAQALMDNPEAASAPNFAQVARAMEQDGVEGNAPLRFEQDPVSGARFALHRNSVMPSGVDPSQITEVEVTDPNTGELVRLPVNPKTGQAMLKPRAPKENRVSPDFMTALGQLAVGLNNPDPERAAGVRGGIKAMIDGAHTLEQLNDKQRDDLYAQFGLGSSGPRPAPSTAMPTDAKGKAALANKIAAENPTWSRAQVIQEMNRRMAQ